MNRLHLEFDRRALERTNCRRESLLCIPGSNKLRGCTMRNASEQGIGLRLHPDCGLLTSKFLTVEEGSWNVRECRLVWREADFAGAEFIDRKRPRAAITIGRQA